jgi:putative transposase
MPFYRRYYHPGQLQFVTSSTYRRTPVFSSQRFCRDFVEVLDGLRHEMQFLLVGWVLMPDHFHLLIKPEPADSTSLILQRLKDRTARRILAALRRHPENGWCRKMLGRFRLPPSVHDEYHCRVWQRRFYPFNVYSERKRLEKLDYMHGNPVQRRLVSSPDQWPWSSWRFYHLEDACVRAMDRCP